MSYNLLNNFKYAFDKLLHSFIFNEYSYKLIDDCIFLHINFEIIKIPLHIKITTRSLYSVDSLYLALYHSVIQLLYKSIKNYNFLSYVYNQTTNILYCIIDFDDIKRDRIVDNCLLINDDSFNESNNFIEPVIINDLQFINNNRFGFIQWNDIFDVEFEKDFD